ncbi:hypothetical protein [Candidatus Accumulibacter sp. ACC012]|jgi:hypothetical protein|uniref:hypothetical protein n=1 Tax=Candidatus Accumulibacter sp. ACC012 TaxID=2823332 RepID=UPI0025C0D161|nr:hypothetical protein [Candidatus Accumulibacter sp. ACC012]
MSDRLRNLVFIPLYILAMPAVDESLTGRGHLSSISAFGMEQENLAVVPQEPCRDTKRILSVFAHDLCTARAPGRMRRERIHCQVRNATGKDVSRPQGEAAGAYDCTHHALLHKDWLGCSLMKEKACSFAWNYPLGDILRGLETGRIGEMTILGDREGRLALVTTGVSRYPGVGVLVDFS